MWMCTVAPAGRFLCSGIGCSAAWILSWVGSVMPLQGGFADRMVLEIDIVDVVHRCSDDLDAQGRMLSGNSIIKPALQNRCSVGEGPFMFNAGAGALFFNVSARADGV